MGMESVYRLSVILNMVDNLSGQMPGVQSTISSSIGKLNSAFGTMQKAGAAMAGIGTGISGLAMSTVTATFDTKNALGELSSLGVKDLQAVENAAKSFSDTWAGTSKSDFITASYDIKSGISSLTDEGVAQFTELAALTGKATKSTTEEMGSLFATGYGIYKGFYDDMSDLAFGEMFSSGIATAVKNYKTSGSEMASAISALGATATNSNIPLEEQLAILGQLQTTMSGSEAATKYKSFLNQASSAGEKLGLTFLDTNNQLLSMPEILAALKSKYGETIDAVEKRELKEAFGTDEAVALIDLLYNNVEMLDGGIQDLQQSMKNGISVTEEMAQAINNTPEQKFQVLKQQIHNNVEELGNGLLPAVNNTMDRVSGLISKGSEWIKNNQETVQTLMNIALKLGVFLILAGSAMGVVGTLGKTFLAAGNAIGLLKTAMMGMNTAFLASPVTWVIAGVLALAAAFVILWNKSEAFRSFWKGLFEQIRSAVIQAWSTIQPAFQNLGQKFMELWQAVQPIIQIIEKAGAVVLVVLGSVFAGAIQGAVSALAPLINAFSSLLSFVTHVVYAVAALFRGDFSGAVDFAVAAINNLEEFFLSGFEAILAFAEGFASGFLDAIGGALSAVGIDASEFISHMKNTFRNGLETVKGFFASILGAAAETVKQNLNNMKAAYEEHGGGIRGAAAAAMEGVKGYYTAGFAFIDNLTGGRLEGIRSTITSKMAAAGTAVSSSLGKIKSDFSEKLEAARAAVTGAIDRIKGAFHFSWSLPKLKLPHINVSGSFSLTPPSAPKFGVEWYREGGILNGPTIFGSMGGSLLGGGEAGAEAVLPLAELWKRMKEIVGGVVNTENEESGESIQKTGSDITHALASKTTTVWKDKETITATRERLSSEKWGKEGDTIIHSIQLTVDISKIKDLPLLYKLIDELKDAQNRTDPDLATA